jgi:hypothetical protein
MMCEVFGEIFGRWQVGFIGGRHEFQIDRVRLLDARSGKDRRPTRAL